MYFLRVKIWEARLFMPVCKKKNKNNWVFCEITAKK